MTRSTWATHLCARAQLSAHVAIMLTALLLCPLMAHAKFTETCLTGTAADVANDPTEIRAVRALVDAGCTCSTFDGTKGHTHTDYVTCAATIIKAQVAAATLRTQCKATVKAYYAHSTCGRNPTLHSAPCIQTSVKTGKVTCAIKPTTKKDGMTTSTACVTSPKVTRVPCPTYTQCLEAADTNGNLVIGAGDSGGCVVPPTATATPTNTPTQTPTSTPTNSPTSTATPTNTSGPCTGQPDGTTCDAGTDSPHTSICVSSTCGQCTSFNGAPRFVDNGNGTITDRSTCLVWEKKDQSATLHNWGNTYQWSQGSGNPDGGAFTVFIAGLNSAGFAGHHDWRLPSEAGLNGSGPKELESILELPFAGSPVVDTAFNTNCATSCSATGASSCSCTQSSYYWSATADSPNVAWGVYFGNGFVDGVAGEGSFLYVRAVRGGL